MPCFFYTVFSLLSFGLVVPAECSTFFSSSSAEIPYSLASAISAEHVIDMSDENSKMFTVEKGKITD